MFEILNDIANTMWLSSHDRKIRDMNQEVERLKESARSTAGTDPLRSQIDELRAANGELRLYVAVLFRTLQAKGVVSREEMSKLAEQIDAEDGRQDKSFTGDVLA